MARNRSSATVDTLEEITSQTERLGAWVAAHAVLLGVLLAVVLAGTGSVAVYRSWSAGKDAEASNALAEVRDAYLAAMGAGPGAIEIPELANPETAGRVREEFVGRFRGVAQEYDGSVPGALAWLEVGDLLEASGDAQAAREAWTSGVESLPAGSALRGPLLGRVAFQLEAEERWQEAAEAHERAAALDGFPLRHWALADAARCYDAAGDTARALELMERIESDPGAGAALSEALRIRLRELRASAAS